MKLFLKCLKWMGLAIGILLLLTLFAGLSFRLFGPQAHPPAGELIEVEGVPLHLLAAGQKNHRPTLVIEGGSGAATEYYHWLSEGLKDSLRVVRYDRAGIGYSGACKTPRDPETIARELHLLLEKAGEAPPYIMAGHSLGGPYVRVFTELYPDEVAGLVLMDATHPERVERFNLPPAASWKFKTMIWMYDALAVLGDLGIMALYDRLKGPMLAGEGLPEAVNERTDDYLLDGKLIRTAAREFQQYHHTLKRSAVVTDVGPRPVRIFTAAEAVSAGERAAYEKRGIDPDQRRQENIELQTEYTSLSPDSKQILIDGGHNSMFTKPENAAIICTEILAMLEGSKGVKD